MSVPAAEIRAQARVMTHDDVMIRMRAPEAAADALRGLSMLNISTGGAAVFASVALGDVPDRLGLSVYIIPLDFRFECEAELRYVLANSGPQHLPRTWLHGARFVALPDRALHAVDAYVAGRKSDG